MWGPGRGETLFVSLNLQLRYVREFFEGVSKWLCLTAFGCPQEISDGCNVEVQVMST